MQGVFGAALTSGRAAARKPNIVYIMADDLGYGDLGCYGQRKIRTPHIDRLAAEGKKFTDAYAGCCVCAPSRSVLMTGLHMGHTSVRCNPGGVPLLPSDVTVAEVLRAAGYRTGLFGKWGLGDEGTGSTANEQGFDEFFGYLHQVHAHIYYPEYLYQNSERYPLPGNKDHGRKQYSADIIAGKALEFIRRNKDQPFFCYMPFTLPHQEFLAPEDSVSEYRGKFPETPQIQRGHYFPQPHPRATFAGMVSRLDRYVGETMALLKELNLDDNTIVFFCSDNGTIDRDNFFGGAGPLRGIKTTLYEGGIRVPMIVRWPGRVEAGVVSGEPWAFHDFLPTAAELAGAKTPPGLDGHSMIPAILGEKAAGRKQKRHEFFYWEMPRYDDKAGEFRKEVPMQAVRMGEWKAVRPVADGPLVLYNLREDIGEKSNVAAANAKVMAKIGKYLKTARTEPRPQKSPPSHWGQVTS